MSSVAHTQRGFTLIELVVTLLVVGVLGATVVLRMSSISDRAVRNQADHMVRDLYHAQSLAMERNARLRLIVNADGTGYSFQCRTVSAVICPAVGNVAIDPASGDRFLRTFTDGVRILPRLWPDNAMDFDTLGRPNIDSILIAVNPARIFTLSNGTDAMNVQVQIESVTGFASTN